MSLANQYIALGRDIRGGLGDIGSAKLQSADLQYQLGRQQKADARQEKMDAYAQPGLELAQLQNTRQLGEVKQQAAQDTAPIENMSDLMSGTFGDMDDKGIAFIAVNNVVPQVAKANGWQFDGKTYRKKNADGTLSPITRQDLHANQAFTRSILEASVDPGHALNDMVERAESAIPQMQDPQQRAQATQAYQKLKQQQSDPRWLLNAYHKQSQKVLNGIMLMKQNGRDASMLESSYERILNKAEKLGDSLYVSPQDKQKFDMEMKIAQAQLERIRADKKDSKQARGQWVQDYDEQGNVVNRFMVPKEGDTLPAIPENKSVSAADDKREEEIQRGQMMAKMASAGLPISVGTMGEVEFGEMSDAQRLAAEGIAKQHNFTLGVNTKTNEKWFGKDTKSHSISSAAWNGQQTSRQTKKEEPEQAPRIQKGTPEFDQEISEIVEAGKGASGERLENILLGAERTYGADFANVLKEKLQPKSGVKIPGQNAEQPQVKQQTQDGELMAKEKKLYKDFWLSDNGDVYAYDKKGETVLVLPSMRKKDQYRNMDIKNQSIDPVEYNTQALKELGLYEEYLNKFGR